MGTTKITVNGNTIEIKENSTIQDFIAERNITGTMFVVEKNLQIVQKQDYSSEKIINGDKIELVGFFGGG